MDGRVQAAFVELESGKSFAEVAEAYSEDLGSAQVGGDLGFTSGDAFPAEMEEAIAQLEPNVVSEPVSTDAGTHILIVTERRDAEAPSLEELRLELTSRIQERNSRDKVVRIADQLRDLAFNAEDLNAPAEELELSIERSGPVTRNQAEGLFANAALLEQAFSEDVLEVGHNSEVVELSGNRFVVMRLVEYKEPEPKPLEEVRDQITAALSEEAALAAIVNEAERALSTLRSGASVESFATENGYAWQVELGARRSNNVLPRELVQRAFQLPVPAQGESSFEFIESRNGDVLVFELARVVPGDASELPAPMMNGLREQLAAESGGLLLGEFERGLRQRADISRL